LKLYLSLEKGDYESKRTKSLSGFFFCTLIKVNINQVPCIMYQV
jgi:hypothetical protein